jgi:hypothetical protein
MIGKVIVGWLWQSCSKSEGEPMRRWKSLAIALLSIVFAAVPGIALTARAQSSAPSQTESDAFKSLQTDKDLDGFVTKYPNSALIPYAYRAYYLKNLRQQNYPQTLLYLDKLLALGDRIDRGARLEALIARSQAYTLGCRDEAQRTPDAYARARDAAADGQRALSAWEKPPNMTDQQFDAQKKNVSALFGSAQGIAEGGLSEPPVDSCKAALPDPGKFDRIMNEIKAQEPQTPPVR